MSSIRNLGTSTQAATDALMSLGSALNKAMKGSFEDQVGEMSLKAVRDGVSPDDVLAAVRETTRDSMTDDLSEDETLSLLAERLERARHAAVHHVTYEDSGEWAEMDPVEFTERVTPGEDRSWRNVLRGLIDDYPEPADLSARLDVARSGGRMTVFIAGESDGTGVVRDREQQEEIAVCLLTGLPVRFQILEVVRADKGEALRYTLGRTPRF